MPNLNDNTAYGNYLASQGNRGFDWRVPAAGLGLPLAAAALPAVFGGAAVGAPATAAGASGAVAAPASGFSLGGLLKAPLTGLGVQGFLSWLGQRSQNKANDKNLAFQASTLEKQLAVDAENRAEQKRQFDVQQAAAKAALEAQNKMDAEKLAAENEDRAYNRQQADYTRSLSEKREAYLQPFRDQALANRNTLMALLMRGR